MLEILKELCSLDGSSGNEHTVKDCIIKKIDGFCDWKIDALGNIIAFKGGKRRSAKRLMIDAHMDEVGLIITSVTEDGFLKFKTVGGIDTSVLTARRVLINNTISGVIGSKPVHLSDADEVKKLPKIESLYIDIGAENKAQALSFVSLGDRAVVCGEYIENEYSICSKALDNRIGCALLIKLIREKSEYDFIAVFSVQEEVGLRGARVATFSVEPDSAIVLEATTAADIAGVSSEKRVCELGGGAAISFMDGATVYDKAYYNAALSSGIICQPKAAVAGGNNSGAIHLSRTGVRTLAISVPCRYIHSASSVAVRADIDSTYILVRYMINAICSGEIA